MPMADRRAILATPPGRALAPAAHRAHEALLAARSAARDLAPGRRRQAAALAGGVPVPPARLRTRVIRNADALRFLVSGRNHQRLIAAALERHGLGAPEALLDFGCGCGRVLRWWPEEVRRAGTDLDPRLAAWCDRHLPGVDARANQLEPPLGYADGEFDVVYSVSIFTHLPERLQRPWIEELARVTRPGGLVLLTVAGDAYRDGLRRADRERYERGELVVRFGERAGSNLCAAVHPRPYVERLLDGTLELVELLPGDPAKRMRQDAYVCRRP